MLRTRLYLGLLPLLLLSLAVGLFAIYTCHELVRTIEQELFDTPADLSACYEMREAATLMDNALAATQRSDVLAARTAYAGQRARFEKSFHERELAATGTWRAPLIQQLDAAYSRFVAQGEKLLAEGTLSPLTTLRENRSRPFRPRSRPSMRSRSATLSNLSKPKRGLRVSRSSASIFSS